MFHVICREMKVNPREHKIFVKMRHVVYHKSGMNASLVEQTLFRITSHV
jgi:hypothetical protein